MPVDFLPSFAAFAFCAICNSFLHLRISSSFDNSASGVGPFPDDPSYKEPASEPAGDLGKSAILGNDF